MENPDQISPQPLQPLQPPAVTGKYGEVLIVPAETDDPILSLDEVRMDFGDPVIEGGVDYGELIQLYRQAVHGEVTDGQFFK